VPLVASIRDTGLRPALPPGPYDVAAQEAFGRRVMADLGFDLEAGRLDVAVHPFCSGSSPDDVRLTTRYRPEGFTESLFGTIHETGHGLYEQGLPAQAGGLPVGDSVSLGIHESQSRLWENMVGRSRVFWEHYLPVAQAHFPGLAGVDVDRIYAAVNRVEASMIRVEADEVTYNLHILLRFELERALLERELAVADLPGAWDERMERYLGIRPADAAEGVLQDVHWGSGLIGYFPTYSLGNLYGAQFYRQILVDLPDLPAQIAQGRFAPLLTWLRERVHSRGKRRTAAELVQDVTGQPLGVDALMDYLEAKFRPLYGLD
jgi:carboxypeptidase Taq